MIVLLTYYSDGSSEPEIVFIENGPDQATRTARIMLEARATLKQTRVFKIVTVDRPAIPIELIEQPITCKEEISNE